MCTWRALWLGLASDGLDFTSEWGFGEFEGKFVRELNAPREQCLLSATLPPIWWATGV